ncbi:MAG: HD-GYP domain-containing protein [Aminobacterium sp.]|uniref:HD-GYP domain-containing protein n=1 Tax=unclassified Aminobacterium TaxID=2685012 RepID=UPI001BCC276E|nr:MULTISPECIES: HD-GYP domain-containing protein [unclassified Aminobacterium]MDD2206307.1 HD-GYP domain-containing protein [Aminobacterium sp.]MDD3426118.1 HD-GYP domain-containing protein [Aminobacterium sp.]MDD3707312.1 HD-GYP domain-containing protein [Aminobacterium sp.]MDD4228324.1 HD-GYP domain-containing protein [Aminobacterium sp.]MDD4551795.1 HD-GYP domain-containing protein [Aminobacterium sp.]
MLPKHSDIKVVMQNFPRLPDTLIQWGIRSVPIQKEIHFSKEDFQMALQDSDLNLVALDRHLAKVTIQQIQDVYERFRSGREPSSEELSSLISNSRSLAKTLMSTPQVLLVMARVRNWDEYTFIHSLNVALLSGFITSRLFPNQIQVVERQVMGGLLHDVGKACISLDILNKPGPLTPREFSIINRHPEEGERLLRESGVSDKRVLAIVRHHHERWKGNGYPDKLRGEQIPFEARIAAVADVFDALTTKRIYRDSLETRQALSMIIQNADTHFDKKIVGVLLCSLGLYPPGTIVELSDYSIGIVIASAGRDILRPKLMLRINTHGDAVRDLVIVDLACQKDLFIRRCLSDIGKSFSA